MLTVAAATLKSQIATVFRAWGMAEDHIATTVELIVEADLRGIDSHGIGMLPTYQRIRREERLNITPDIKVVRDLPTMQLIDADHALGHVPSRLAMQAAIDKAANMGVGLAAVRNSNHFGAAGVYASMALERGFIGITVTGTTQRSIVPTFAREPMFSTNPIAFAAPAGRNEPFLLDMATSTVAVGKLNIARRAGKQLPVGWATKPDGTPETDAAAAVAATPKRMTPLGGTRPSGSHKGYGLAVMVDTLASLLGGSWFGGHDPRTGERGRYINVGHCHLVLDAALFRGSPAAFTADMDRLLDWLHSTPPADPAQPVLIAGEPERAARAERLAKGIPMTDTLVAEVRQVCEANRAEFILAS